MKNYVSVLKWLKYVLPLVLVVVIWLLIYLNSFFKESPDFTLYALVWILVTIYLQWKSSELINAWLDRRIGWNIFWKRLIYQTLIIIIIGVVIFDSTFFILNWLENNYLDHNNTLTIYHLLSMTIFGIILSCFISIIQMGLQFSSNWKKSYKGLEKIESRDSFSNTKELRDENNAYVQRFIVKKGNRMHVLPIFEIAYFEKDELVFAITKNNEKFIINYSLKELMNLVDPVDFFRISRQHIVSLHVIREWSVVKNNIIIGMGELTRTKLKVSQRNIPKFKAWASEFERK